jgi:competence protein ComEA
MSKYIAVFLMSILSLMAAININTADITTLTHIKGIGPSKAKAIVEYRKKHGRFESVEELIRINGIGKKTFEKIKSDITVK